MAGCISSNPSKGRYGGISVEKRVFTQNRFHLPNFYQSTFALADDLQSLKRLTKPTVFEAFQRELFFSLLRQIRTLKALKHGFALIVNFSQLEQYWIGVFF